jgi:hypothetical protein
MPRDLTDLMERAVASAPPEPHHASDITRLAQRHQRRRTSFVAGAATLAVVAAAGGAFGLTRSHATTPEPAQGFKLDQTVDLSQVVPASTLPGYTLLPWTIPSVQEFGSGERVQTYHSVDAAGRLLVVDAPGGSPEQGPFRSRLYDAPGGAPQPLQAPASTGTVRSVPITWLPEFYGTDHLLWHQSTGAPGFHLTDLRGGHDEFVPAAFRVGTARLTADPDDLTGRSMWMTDSHTSTTTGVTVYDIYRATFSGQVTKEATGVSALDVGPGIAGWVTTHGRVFVQSATGTAPQRVPIHLDAGCRVLHGRQLQALGGFAVASSAVAIAEGCGSGHEAVSRVLAFDLSGRRLVRITGVDPFDLSFGGDTLLFKADELALRYDLLTGTLAQLGVPGPQTLLGAGRYVLWYDDQSGGHVADIPH